MRAARKWGTADPGADISSGPAGISAGIVDIFDANKLMVNWTP